MTTTTQAGPTGRLALLLAAIRRQGGRWTTARTARFYKGFVDVPETRRRAVARGDLRDLHAWGWLDLNDAPDYRHYTLNSRKDVRK